MIRKMTSLFAIFMFFSSASISQTRVLTTNGKTFQASSVEVNNENLIITVDGETQTLTKSNVLAVVPKGKTAYTYRIKGNKKLSIKKKDIYNNYEGADKPRLFAHKYVGTKSNISQLYILNADKSMTEEQFKEIYDEQQKKFTSRNTLSIVLAVGVLLLGAISLSSSLKTANSLSYNNLDPGVSGSPNPNAAIIFDNLQFPISRSA